MTEAYIFDAVRTPRGRGKASGALHEVSPVRLATTVLRAIKERNNLRGNELNDVLLGCAAPIYEQASNIGIAATLAAGFEHHVPGAQLNRFCGSGLEACNFAAAMVKAGQADLMIGGGAESMSRVPLSDTAGPWLSDPQITIPQRIVPQGISADLIATLHGFSRHDVDAFAVESQHRAGAAMEKEHFVSIVPVFDKNGVEILARDEFPRPETTLTQLSALEPSFAVMGQKMGFDAIAMMRYPMVEAIEHVHHAGNSSGIVDGASAVLIGSEEAAKAHGLKPRAKIKAFGVVSSEPTIMLTGPAPAARAALKRAGMEVGDIDLFECNEAFAAVALLFMRELGISADKVNVNGGAIAFGHPLGATGGMLIGTLLDELERRDKATGLITLCIGGGMGTAMIIERV